MKQTAECAHVYICVYEPLRSPTHAFFLLLGCREVNQKSLFSCLPAANARDRVVCLSTHNLLECEALCCWEQICSRGEIIPKKKWLPILKLLNVNVSVSAVEDNLEVGLSGLLHFSSASRPSCPTAGGIFGSGAPIEAGRDVGVLLQLLLLQHGGGMQWGSSGQLLPGEVVCYFESIVSTSCGSGVIGAGCCRPDRVERSGGKSAGGEGK